MNYHYVKIDEITKIVTGVSELGASIDRPDMIQIDSYDTSLLDKKYNGNDEQGKPVFIDAPKVPETIISSGSFWDRFIEAEQELLVESSNKKIKKFLYELTLRPEFDLTDQKVINAINTLESAGIIGAGRAKEILEVS